MTSPLRTAYQGSRSLTVLSAVMAVLLAVCVAGLFLDDRTVLGQPVWLKPAKFALSFVVSGLTLAWLLAHLRRGRRLARWSADIVAVTSLLEVAAITFQAARGRSSHFNTGTALDEAMWRSMGGFIAFVWIGTVIITILLWRDGMPDRARTWAVRLGLLLLSAGFLQAITMVIPRPEQIALDEQGVDTLLGAHAVGVADGGPGMPVTGWSITGGDLRIGHFIGIHGLQAMMLFAMLVTWLVADAARRTRLVAVFAMSYTGLLVLVTWQALRGQPLVSPDATTAAAAVAWAVLTAVAAAAVWIAPVRRTAVAG
jgi:hypothetical protein